MARTVVDLILVLYLALSGHFTFARGLAIRNSPAMEENCVLSFVVPREKVKSSCDVEAKVQRRINAVETRADVYRQQVTKLSMQVEKQMVASANRLDRVEAEMNAMSEVAGTNRDSSNSLGQLSKRLSVLERGMNQLYARISASQKATGTGAVIGQTIDGEGAGQESSGRAFTDNAKEGKYFGFGLEDNLMTAEIESLVKSMVNAEVQRHIEEFKTSMQEYKQVFSLFLPPEKDVTVDSEIDLTRELKGFAGDDKQILGNEQSTVIKYKMNDNANDTDVFEMLRGENSKADRMGNTAAQEIVEYIQNMTSETQIETLADVYLISDDLSDTNDTFSGDNIDFNATGILAMENGDEFNTGFNRSDEAKPSAKSKNSIQNSTGDKLHAKRISETANPGWMRDEVDRQSVAEERFKTLIRAMLVRPLANVVSLMEKKAASLKDEIQLQGKRTQESLKEVHDRVDNLDGNAKAIGLQVESLSTGFRESHGRLDRMKKLEVAVHELKKNLSSSMAFLNDEAATDNYRVEGKKEEKSVKGLSHLVKLYNTNLEHHANETTRIINDIKSEVEEKIDEIRKRLPDNENELKYNTEQTMRKVNTTLRDLNLRIEEMENQILEQKTDLGLHITGSERKRDGAERDFKDLRKAFGSLRSKQRELFEQVRGLDHAQTRLGDALSETETKISDLKLDLQLTVSDEWVPLRFAYDASRTLCFGEQYVRRLHYKKARYVGVMLCNSHRYKIFLGTSLDDTFLNIGDTQGLGEDHCEFVGAERTAEVKLSGPTTRFDSVTGYSRKSFGEEVTISKINLLKPSPQWYECGVTIP